jgi:hypothetical protein
MGARGGLVFPFFPFGILAAAIFLDHEGPFPQSELPFPSPGDVIDSYDVVRPRILGWSAAIKTGELNVLATRVSEVIERGQQPLSETQIANVQRFFHDLVDGGYTDLAYSSLRSIGPETGIGSPAAESFLSAEGIYELVSRVIVAGGFLSQEAIDAIDASMTDPEELAAFERGDHTY